MRPRRPRRGRDPRGQPPIISSLHPCQREGRRDGLPQPRPRIARRVMLPGRSHELTGIRTEPLLPAADAHHIDPALLQPSRPKKRRSRSNSGNNVSATAGRPASSRSTTAPGRSRARGPMDPAKNADMAGRSCRTTCSASRQREPALSAYNAGAPNAPGTLTTWRRADPRLANSVMRHLTAIVPDSKVKPLPTAGNGARRERPATLGASQPARRSRPRPGAPITGPLRERPSPRHLPSSARDTADPRYRCRRPAAAHPIRVAVATAQNVGAQADHMKQSRDQGRRVRRLRGRRRLAPQLARDRHADTLHVLASRRTQRDMGNFIGNLIAA